MTRFLHFPRFDNLYLTFHSQDSAACGTAAAIIFSSGSSLPLISKNTCFRTKVWGSSFGLDALQVCWVSNRRFKSGGCQSRFCNTHVSFQVSKYIELCVILWCKVGSIDMAEKMLRSVAILYRIGLLVKSTSIVRGLCVAAEHSRCESKPSEDESPLIEEKRPIGLEV